MEVRLAEHHGMCFGVRDAIALALGLTEQGPLSILGDLVHNPDVVACLDRAGAVRAQSLDDITSRAVLLTAHGASNRVKLELRLAGKEVHDATCPLVTRAHLALKKLVADGWFPVVIGQRDHVEVKGLVGDLDECFIFLDEAEIDQLQERFGDGTGVRLGIVSQTTQPVERVRELADLVKRSLPCAAIRLVDTVCQPTKDRQEALRKLATEADAIVVVGGAESNNSRKLVELARQLGCRAYQVHSASDLRPEWFAGVKTVGLTAGTSTPDAIIEAVREQLTRL